MVQREERVAATSTVDATMRLRGRVVTTSGEPVAACAVSCGPVRATSDASGSFSLAAVLPREHWICAARDGFVQLPTPPVRGRAGASVDVLVRMEPARVLRGRVLSRGGRPIAGARVDLRLTRCAAQPDWRPSEKSREALSTRTDTRGAFLVGPLFRGRCTLEVQHPAYLGFARGMSTGESQLTIRLDPLGSVRGRIIDAETGSAVPIERLSVLVSHHGQQGPWRVLPVTSWHAAEGLETGCFRVYCRTRRFLKVVVGSSEFAPTSSPPFRLSASEDPRVLVLRARLGIQVRSLLIGAEGGPVSVGEITVHGMPPLLVASLSCGLDGRFATSPLAPGRYVLRARSPGHLTTTVRDVVVSPGRTPDSLRISLRAAGRVCGTVFARRIGVLPGMWVTAKRVDAPGLAWQRAPIVRVHDRRFEFSELEPGKYQFELRGQDAGKASNCAPLAVAHADVRGSTSSNLSLDVSGLGSSVSGSLLCDGRLQPCAEVVLQRGDHRLIWRCVTDAMGRFHFTALPIGEYRISYAGNTAAQRHLSVDGVTQQRSCDLEYSRW